MADFYLDHNAYNVTTNRLGLDTPPWGVPQEGDGAALAPSSAASIAEIKINAVPTASETLVIAGATITAGASAAANVFVRGANVQATAANIVTLLNSANATAVVGASVAIAVGNLANQLRNMVYARVKPGQTDTVQIMFRVGSDALNHANNSAVAISSAGWGTAPTVTQFAGGVSGCWGCLAAIEAWGQASSIVKYRYGVLFERPHVCRVSASNPVYQLLDSDVVWLRSGNGYTITIANSNSAAFRSATAGNLNLVLDTNTKWTGDSGNGVVKVTQLGSGLNYVQVRLSTVAYAKLTLTALKKYGLQIGIGAVGNTFAYTNYTFAFCHNNQSHFRAKNVRFFDESDNGDWRMFGCSQTSGWYGVELFENCTFEWTKQRTSGSGGPLIGWGGYQTGYQRTQLFIGCDVFFNYAGVTPPPLLNGNSSFANLRWIGGKVTGCAGNIPLFGTLTNLPSPTKIVVDGVSGVDLPAAYVGVQAVPSLGSMDEDNRTIQLRMNSPGFPFRYEDQATIVDWLPSSELPTLAGTMPDGTAFSLRMLWFNSTASDMCRGSRFPLVSTPSRIDPEVAGTITINLFVPSSVVFNAVDLSAVVTFADADTGLPVSLSATGADLVASAATWANAASHPGHVARKIVLSTGTTRIKKNADVTAIVTLYGTPGTGANEFVYLDPELSITT